jgi:hypothetical protein
MVVMSTTRMLARFVVRAPRARSDPAFFQFSHDGLALGSSCCFPRVDAAEAVMPPRTTTYGDDGRRFTRDGSYSSTWGARSQSSSCSYGTLVSGAAGAGIPRWAWVRVLDVPGGWTVVPVPAARGLAFSVANEESLDRRTLQCGSPGDVKRDRTVLAVHPCSATRCNPVSHGGISEG